MVATASTLKCAGESSAGRVRDNNEDRIYYDLERGIFVVIDGIGGQAAGEVAAETALNVIRARLERQTGEIRDRLREAITLANNQVYRLATTRDEWNGMACVLTVALVGDGQATIGHVGDTRLYQVSPGKITKITRDHSPVGEREDACELTEIEAMSHPRRNEVLRDVGSEEHAPDDEGFIDITEIPFPPDSALLMCTDGLSDLLTSAQMMRAIEEHAGDGPGTAHRLVEMANESGGKDNVSLLFIEGENFGAALRKHLALPDVDVKNSAVIGAPGDALSSQAPAAVRGLFGLAASRWAFLGYVAILGILIIYNAQLALRSRLSNSSDGNGGIIARGPMIHVVGRGSASGLATIRAALERAQPGDIIQVAPGEYTEPVELKDGVALVSQKPREAVIRVAAGDQGGAVAVVGNKIASARFTGFRIEGDEQNGLAVGLRLTDAAVEVEDVEITGAKVTGVELAGDPSATLRANYIHDNPGSGITIRAGGTPRIVNNLVTRNGRRSDAIKPGVEIDERAQPLLMWNVITENGADDTAALPATVKQQIVENNFFLPGAGLGASANPQKAKR